MSKTVQRTLDTLGLSPWQALAVIAAGAFYVGDMRPKLAAGEKLTISVDKLTETVATLTTKVEVHAVLLANVAEIKSELRELRDQVAKLQPKTASTH